MLTSQEYKEIENIFQQEIKRLFLLMPKEDIETVEQYLSNAEIEMAFELFGLSIIHHHICLSTESIEVLLSLGLRLNLDQESVYDTDFWINLTTYFNSLLS